MNTDSALHNSTVLRKIWPGSMSNHCCNCHFSSCK